MHNAYRYNLSIYEQLIEKYGYFIPALQVWRLLGYTSTAAYRKARSKGTLPIQEFDLENRKGKFVSTEEVSNWIENQLLQEKSRQQERL